MIDIWEIKHRAMWGARIQALNAYYGIRSYRFAVRRI